MNLPNKITIARIIMIPFIMFFYLADFIPYGKLIAIALFLIASFSDMLDGYIARKYNMITNMGKFLDPIADKILTSTAFFLLATDVAFANYGTIWAIALTIIFAREFIVAALRQVAASKSVVIAADKWGKWKTVSQMAATVFLMFYVAIVEYNWFVATNFSIIFLYFSMAILGISILLTVISGINYCVANKSVFKVN